MRRDLRPGSLQRDRESRLGPGSSDDLGLHKPGWGFPEGATGISAIEPAEIFQSESRGTEEVERENFMVGAIVGLLIIVAIVLVLLKVAVAGGILGLIAIVLLILLLLGRI
jgi:hypothetical protein